MRLLKAYWRLFAASFRANLKAAAEYKVNFLAQVLGMMLNNGAFAVFWAVIMDKSGGLGGYGFPDVMLIWALVSSSFGLGHVLCGNVRSLGKLIIEGDLDVYLLQPKDPFFNALISKTRVSGWGDLAYGFLVLALLPEPSPARAALFALLTLTGAAIFVASFAMAESLAFFVGNSQALSQALTEFILSFSLYPEGVFPKGMRWLFYSLVPAGFIAFIPLGICKDLDWGLALALVAAAIAYVAAASAFFRAGLRRYESGNKVGARM